MANQNKNMTQDNQHNEMPKDTVEEFLQAEPMVRLFAVENNAMATGRLGQYHGKTVREALLDFYTTAYNKGVEVGRVEERERIEGVFIEAVPPHAMDLEDSVWLKRLLNKAFNHN